MAKTVIAGHTEKAMRKAGKKDGRLWRWTIKPWFITAKEPLPSDSKQLAPRIEQVAKAAGDQVAEILRGWHYEDGECQKKAQDAVSRIEGYIKKNASDGTDFSTLTRQGVSEYGSARVDRRTAWKSARARILKVDECYEELAKAYVHANQQARRDSKFAIFVPSLEIPDDLKNGAIIPIESALGLTAEKLQQLGLRPDDDSSSASAA